VLARSRLTLASAVALGLVAAACGGGTSPGCGGDLEAMALPVREHADARPFRILWLGDTLLADAATPRLEANGYDWPFARLLPLPEADYVIANAEGPITTETAVYDRTQPWTYNAQPEAAAALARLGVTAAGLANNHALDRGPAGLADTLAHLDAAGVEAFGAGEDLAAALRPLLIETPHGRVGVLAFGQGEGVRKNAAGGRPGGAVVTPCAVREGAQLAREAGARWLVGFVHWGSNYADVQHTQRRQAALFAEAGYEFVIGHGSHVAQPVASVRGMPVVYSLGNFVFGTPGRFSAAFPGVGLIATTELGAGGFEALRLRCIRTDNDEVRFQPRPCAPAQADAALRALHPDIAIVRAADGTEGVLRWPVR
jgi:hypothetical protein